MRQLPTPQATVAVSLCENFLMDIRRIAPLRERRLQRRRNVGVGIN
jgi:hypothetical protein